MPGSRSLRIAAALLPLVAGAPPARAQTTPEAFLDAAPPLPRTACGVSRDERMLFERKAGELATAIGRELDRREAEARAANERMRAQAEAGIVARSGLTAEEVKGAQAGGKSRDAAVDSVMLRQTGISPEQARALAAMSEDERRAWALAHAGELGARAPTPGAANRAADASRLQRIAQHQAELARGLHDKEQRLKRRLEELDAAAKPDAAEIHAVWARIPGGHGEGGETPAEAAERRRLEARQATLVRQYCDRYAPRLLEIIADYRDYAKAAIADGPRIEADEAEAQKLSTGVAASVERGRTALTAVREYVRVLSDAYRYDYTH